MRVLVVDDDRDVLESVVEVLRGAKFEVAVAEGGRAALDALRVQRADAIVLDLALPDMGGDELLEAMRQEPGLEHIPVIVTSGWARNIDPPVAVAGWLPKPIDPRELVALLERLSEAAHGATAP